MVNIWMELKVLQFLTEKMWQYMTQGMTKMDEITLFKIWKLQNMTIYNTGHINMLMKLKLLQFENEKYDNIWCKAY